MWDGEHSNYYKHLEDVKEYLHPGGVKFFLLDAYPKLKERYYTSETKPKAHMWMALISTLYLTAARVNEIPPTMMSNLSVFKENETLYFRIKILNLKNKKRRSKVITVSYSTPHDRVFIKIITKWYKYLYKKYDLFEETNYTWKEVLMNKFKNDEDKIYVKSLLSKKYLFPSPASNKNHISKSSIQIICNKVLDCNAHFLRKLRASVLVDKFKANTQQLKEYMGHSEIASATPYVSISQTSLKKLVANKQFV